MEALLPLIVTFGLMWALLIRPQQRRVRQHQELVATLGPGDEVITTGGIVGSIVSVVDDIVTLEVAPAISIRVLRSAVQTRIAGEGEEEGVVNDIDVDALDVNALDVNALDDGDLFDDGDLDDGDLFDEAQFDAEPVAEPPVSPVEPAATAPPGAPADDVSYIPPTPITPPTTPPTTEEKA